MLLVPIFQLFLGLLLEDQLGLLLLTVLGLQLQDLGLLPQLDDFRILFGLLTVVAGKFGGRDGRVVVVGGS